MTWQLSLLAFHFYFTYFYLDSEFNDHELSAIRDEVDETFETLGQFFPFLGGQFGVVADAANGLGLFDEVMSANLHEN